MPVHKIFEPLFSCLSLVERSLPGQHCLVPRVTCSLVAHEHLPPGRCWMPCQICIGLPVARLNPASLLHLLPSLFIQPAYHEASPVMIQRGLVSAVIRSSSSSRKSNINNNDNNNNHSSTNTTIIKLWSGLCPNNSGG